jgi:hypothetical protein
LKEFRSQIDIDAPAAAVWRALTDFSTYPDWNPFVVSADGSPVAGARIRINVRLAGLPEIPLPCKVLVADPERELRWAGSLLVPGLFSAEHYFLIEPLDGNRVRLLHGELFTGLLVGAMARMLDARARPCYELLNVALKERVESQVASGKVA